MSNVTNATSSSFFPKKDVNNTAASKKLRQTVLNRNDSNRKEEIDTSSKKDAKVTIPEAIKDFSRIKKAVDAAPELNKTDKIAALKAQIEAGTYKVDYEALADKILEQEF